ncbi:S41 family peptidase [Tissierellaceae bacterium HCP3S3_D8]
MKNIFKRKMLLLLAFVLVFTTPGITAFGETVQKQDTGDIDLVQELNYLGKMLQLIEANYAYDITERDLMDGAMKGLFYNLDEYSNYYTEREFKQLSEELSGDFAGIGVNITRKNGYITVITPLKDTPGYKAGILPGDIIVSVDGVDVTKYTTRDASELIRGVPGTKVKLGIVREGSPSTIYIEVTRQNLEINPIDYEIIENNIGYIKITEFNNHTLENMVKALNDLNKKNIKDIIFDVRNNPGGGLNEVINVLRLLVPKGPIVHVKNSDGKLESYGSFADVPKYNMAVLVNKGSASAAEIFAGAIKDRKLGTIIGTTTFGKGTVQTVIPLTNGGGIKLTIAEYLTANENPVNKVGIEPDIVVEDNLEKDLQLKKAIEVLKNKK